VTAAAELAEHDERIARRIALLTAEQMAPGMGSMILPPHLIERMATWQPWTNRGALYPFSDFLELETIVRPADRTIALHLHLNGQWGVWSGMLRGAGAAPA
jgi:hypothetical protein